MRSSSISCSSIEHLEQRNLFAAPFTVADGPGVFPDDFRVTTFAKRLNFPLGMQRLEDGSSLVPTTRPGASFMEDSTGQLLRLVDNDGSGKADDRGTILADNLPGPPRRRRHAGALLSGRRAARPHQRPASSTAARSGPRPSDGHPSLGSLDLTSPRPWGHLTCPLETRPTPGQRRRYDLCFTFAS